MWTWHLGIKPLLPSTTTFLLLPPSLPPTPWMSRGSIEGYSSHGQSRLFLMLGLGFVESWGQTGSLFAVSVGCERSLGVLYSFLIRSRGPDRQPFCRIRRVRTESEGQEQAAVLCRNPSGSNGAPRPGASRQILLGRVRRVRTELAGLEQAAVCGRNPSGSNGARGERDRGLA